MYITNIKLSILWIMLLGFSHSSCQLMTSKESLDAISFNQKMLSTDSSIVIDVRTPGEFAEGYINRAINIDYKADNFESNIDKLDKNKTYFVYCYSGGRSGKAASYMRSNGFRKVYELSNGLLAWNSKNLPLEGVNNQANTDKISMENYKKLISSDKVVLIDYYAPWCEPCKKLQPILENIQQQYKGKLTVIRLNIDENKQLAIQLSIQSIPLMKIFKNGVEIWSNNGMMEETELKKIIVTITRESKN